MPAEWAGRLVLVRGQLERPMYDFKNSFSPDFVYIHRAKYIFPETYFAYTISEQKFMACSSSLNFCSEMVEAKHVYGKNIFCSMNVDKIREKRIFEIAHWPFELSPN